MHEPSSSSSSSGSSSGGLGGLFSVPCPLYHFTVPDMTASIALRDPGPSGVTCQSFRGPESRSWERRCHRKHKRRADDEACSPKRRRLSEDEAVSCEPTTKPLWPQHCCPERAPLDPSSTLLLAQEKLPSLGMALPSSPSPAPNAPDPEGSSMEVEAAQRRLQEIEERITLEDDDDDEGLDEDPFPRRPVLVLSDSMRQGLQRGVGDILPQNVAQSVSQSCMQLVVWRPPEDALSRRVKDSLHRQRQQQQKLPCAPSSGDPATLTESTATSTSSPGPLTHLTPAAAHTHTQSHTHLTDFGQQAFAMTFDPQAAPGPGEEDMEL